MAMTKGGAVKDGDAAVSARVLNDEEAQFCASLARKFVASRATPEEIEVVTQQLGRYPRGMVAVGARCVCGTPLAVVTRPLVEGKIPFPTTCYLTSPEAVKAMSHLEASGVMNAFNAELTGATDTSETATTVESASENAHADLRAEYAHAHEMYMAMRHELAGLLGDSEEHIGGISAGGMPVRVKCLHALCAQSLVMGRGVNPLGDKALDLAADEFSPNVCRCSVRLK